MSKDTVLDQISDEEIVDEYVAEVGPLFNTEDSNAITIGVKTLPLTDKQLRMAAPRLRREVGTLKKHRQVAQHFDPDRLAKVSSESITPFGVLWQMSRLEEALEPGDPRIKKLAPHKDVDAWVDAWLVLHPTSTVTLAKAAVADILYDKTPTAKRRDMAVVEYDGSVLTAELVVRDGGIGEVVLTGHASTSEISEWGGQASFRFSVVSVDDE